MSKSFGELKAEYPKLWERACKRFQAPEARKKAFLAMVKIEKARALEKQIRAKEKAKEKKRRTRALLLFATKTLEFCTKNLRAWNSLEEQILKNGLWAKEGKEMIDYSDYVRKEFKRIYSRLQEEEKMV